MILINCLLILLRAFKVCVILVMLFKHLEGNMDMPLSELSEMLKVLRYHVKKARSKKIAYEYLIEIVKKIMPLIRLIRPDLIEKWMGDKQTI